MKRIGFSEIEGFEAIDAVFAEFLERRHGEPLPPEFLAAGALASRAVREGHSCCRLELWAGQPVGEGENFTRFPELDAWLAVLRRTEFRSLIATPTSPLALDNAGRLYLRRYYDCEKRIAGEIRRRVARMVPPPDLPPGALAGLLPYFAAASGHARIDHQQLAIYTAMSNSFSIITGGPGTGKTTVVAALLALELQRNPELSIALCAPTGKAQARLTESLADGVSILNVSPEIRSRLLGLSGSTIHKLLGIGPRGTVRYDRENPLPADLVIVDESSMVPLLLMARLLDALRPECRIVLLGDKDQLASVEAGAVLSDLCDTATLNTLRPEAAEAFRLQTGWSVPPVDGRPLSGAAAELAENHRFAFAPRIGEFSRAIRSLELEAAAPLAERMAHCADPDFTMRDVPIHEMERSLRKLLSAPVCDSYSVADLKRLAAAGDEESIAAAFRVLDSFRILAATRKGLRGVDAINALVRSLLGLHEFYAPGVPVMITRNDSRMELYNGDVGIVAADPEKPGVPRIHFPNKSRSYLPVELPEHETVFAMTVHKSQGSGFRNVLLVLPDEPNPVLTRELVYTAVTRAEKRVELWGSETILADALRRKTVRLSGLADRLRGAGLADAPVNPSPRKNS